MSDLYTKHSPNTFGLASRSDVLEWLGWEKCEECIDGWVFVEDVEPFQGGYMPTHGADPCPNCLDGLVPPASQVEALAETLWRQFLAIWDQDWSVHSKWEENTEVHEKWRNRARAALIAAMEGVGE